MLVAAATCLLILLVIKVLEWRTFYRRLSTIPGPKPSFIFGNLNLFYELGQPLTSTIGHRLNSLAKEYVQHGLYIIYVGWKPIVTIFNPTDFQIILNSSKLIEKSTEYRHVEYWLGKGLAQSKGSRWAKHRKIIQPAFHTPLIKKYFLPIFNKHAINLCAIIGRKKVLDDSLDVVLNVTLDTICETVLGVRGSVTRRIDAPHPYAKSLQRFTEILVYKMFTPWLWSDAIFYLTSTGKEMRYHHSVMDKFVTEIVKERKEVLRQSLEGQDQKPVKGLALLDLLLKFHLDGLLTEEDVKDEVNTFTFAGHDTVGISITFTLFLLGHHLDIQEKVQEELDEVIDDENPEAEITDEHICQLKYLDCVIKESLRLFPPGPTFGRCMTEEVTLSTGHTIPKGTDVFLNVMALHRNDLVFGEAESFKPDRFMEGNAVQPGSFAPFSLGPRNCIGHKFALMEEKVMLAHVLRRFTVRSLLPLREVTVNFEITLRSRSHLSMKFTKRGTCPSRRASGSVASFDVAPTHLTDEDIKSSPFAVFLTRVFS